VAGHTRVCVGQTTGGVSENRRFSFGTCPPFPALSVIRQSPFIRRVFYNWTECRISDIRCSSNNRNGNYRRPRAYSLAHATHAHAKIHWFTWFEQKIMFGELKNYVSDPVGWLRSTAHSSRWRFRSRFPRFDTVHNSIRKHYRVACFPHYIVINIVAHNTTCIHVCVLLWITRERISCTSYVRIRNGSCSSSRNKNVINKKAIKPFLFAFCASINPEIVLIPLRDKRAVSTARPGGYVRILHYYYYTHTHTHTRARTRVRSTNSKLPPNPFTRVSRLRPRRTY